MGRSCSNTTAVALFVAIVPPGRLGSALAHVICYRRGHHVVNINILPGCEYAPGCPVLWGQKHVGLC